MNHLIPLMGGGASNSPDWLQGSNIVGLLVFVASIALAFVGVLVVMKAGKNNVRKSAEVGINALIGFILIAAAIGGSMYTFGGNLFEFFIGS